MSDTTYRQIAMLRQQDGNSSDSFEAINKIVNPVTKAEALAFLALQQVQSGDDTAYYSLDLSEAAADRKAAEKQKAPGVVAVTYGLLGNFARAEEILTSRFAIMAVMGNSRSHPFCADELLQILPKRHENVMRYWKLKK